MNKIKKIYYSISEVSKMANVEPHVLRFWEKEISLLRPKRGKSRSRAYRERDIRIVLVIKDLLYKQKYTIQGASEQLSENPNLLKDRPTNDKKNTMKVANIFQEFRVTLQELKNLIEED